LRARPGFVTRLSPVLRRFAQEWAGHVNCPLAPAATEIRSAATEMHCAKKGNQGSGGQNG